jgi:S-adenosylmethionine-diacylgycerolhomoserine-N-methlytransferase
MIATSPEAALQGYYALHSKIYDATRWSFLFGRERILHRIAAIDSPKRILEVGCGTGRNLLSLRRIFPLADITGVDLSSDMLQVAQQKVPSVKLLQQSYDKPVSGDFDLVLCSYALTMFNPGWDTAIHAASEDLREGGLMSVVDFSHTQSGMFRRWMGVNHVRMENHLWPLLCSKFAALEDSRHAAYAGLWHYGMFIGRKKQS